MSISSTLHLKLGELVSYSRSITRPFNPSGKKFIIFTQARTGGMLLTDLMNCHPDLMCEGEILFPKRYIPYRYLVSRPYRFPQPTYGCKIKIDELLYTQKVDPTRFITSIYRLGWKIIFLRRDDILAQSISRILSVMTNKWHTFKYKDIRKGRYTINPEELIQQLEFRNKMKKEQENSLRFSQYTTLIYERDLLNTPNHQKTMDNIFNYLDLTPVSVNTKYLKSTSTQLKDIIVNYEEIQNATIEAGFEELILKHNSIIQNSL
jgi:hypothetical protein